MQLGDWSSTRKILSIFLSFWFNNKVVKVHILPYLREGKRGKGAWRFEPLTWDVEGEWQTSSTNHYLQSCLFILWESAKSFPIKNKIKEKKKKSPLNLQACVGKGEEDNQDQFMRVEKGK